MAKKKKIKEEFAEKKMVTCDGKSLKVGDYFNIEDFCEINDNMYILHHALLRVAKIVFDGIESKQVNVEQAPQRVNNWSATVSILFTFGNGVSWAAAADCRAETANEGYKNYTVSLAETRAEARALRNALGIPFTSSEEISSVAVEDLVGIDDSQDIEPQQVAVIEKKFFNEKGKNVQDVELIIGRPISNVRELTKGEAKKVLLTWNKEK